MEWFRYCSHNAIPSIIKYASLADASHPTVRIMIEIARGIINVQNAKDTATTSFVPFLQKHFDIDDD